MPIGIWQLYGHKIKSLRDAGYPLHIIAREVGVSKERVRQVLQKHYGSTQLSDLVYREKVARIAGCSVRFLKSLEDRGVIKPIHRGAHYLYTQAEVSKVITVVRSSKSNIKPLIPRQCQMCGKIFYVKPYMIRKNSPCNFCSRECKGKWLGINYGFATHHKKWDYDKICQLRQETNWSCSKISEVMGIPEGTVYRVLRARLGPLRKTLVTRTPKPLPITEKECIGCGAIHTRRSPFCSVECYNRIRALVRYYEGTYHGGKKPINVTCCVCGVEVKRLNTKHRHFCDEHLREFRKQVGKRLRTK